MTEADKLIARIDALEIHLVYQDEVIETLNAAVTAQWTQIDALTRQLARLSEKLDEASAGAPDVVNERPPHY